jgi:autotransporter-associated beta strand protein
VANQGTAGTYTIGGSTDNNAMFSGAITVNQPLTISQVANSGANALTISGGIASAGGSQTLTFAGPGNLKVMTAAIGNGSGQLAVNVTGGTLNLAVANTYTGATTVTNGTLLVNGSLAAGSAVTVGAGGVLGGSGTINGPATVQSGGTLSPGGSLSTLTFNSTLTLNAGSTSVFEISKSPVTNDVAKVSGSVVFGGTLIVTNIGSVAFANGDSNRLFNAASYGGAFTSVQLPPLPSGLAWNTSALNTSGILSVVVKPRPVISSAKISSGGLNFDGNSGAGYANFYLLGSTNLAAPISTWLRLLTNQFDAAGGFNFTNPMDSNLPCTFYLLQIP